MLQNENNGSGIFVFDKKEYMAAIVNEKQVNGFYDRTNSRKTKEISMKVKKLVGELHRDGVIFYDLKQYLTQKEKCAKGKVEGKSSYISHTYSTIVNGINTPTERLAELTEHELNEYVETS